MKKVLFFLLPIILAIGVFLLITVLISRGEKGKGAIQVTAVPQAQVYLNGTIIGKTPLYKDQLVNGDYIIKLVPTNGDQPFEQKITILKSALTVVDETFAGIGKSQGSIITLVPLVDNKTAQIFVTTFPDVAQVSLDSNKSVQSPALMKDVTDSDHTLVITKDGYGTKTIHIHTKFGYEVHVTAFLGVNLTPAVPSPTTVVASPSAVLSQKVIILDTPTGFLRVRDDSSTSGKEIAQVKPGTTYVLLSEKDGWFQVQLDGKSGWISSSYAKKQ